MRRRLSLLLLGAGLAFVAACSGVPFAPKWSSDFFLPIQFADVQLGGAGGLAPGGTIPPVNVSSTSPVNAQDVGGATKQILSESVNSITADVIMATSADLTGFVIISVAPDSNNLFSKNPSLAVTDSIAIRKTAGDTSHVSASVSLFQTPNQNNGGCTIGCGSNTDSSANAVSTLYTRSKTTLRCASTCTGLTASDKLQLGVNLTVNVAVSK